LPYPTQPGQVGGHEGVGTIVKMGIGNEKADVKVGDRVGVKWLSGTCGSCAACLSGHDGVCFHQKISGYYTPGTFQQYVTGPANYVTPIPDGLDSAQAAPMLCAGVTTYAALRKSGAKSGEFVVILGSGGGLGHIGLQIGRSMGFRMIGIDADAKKDISVNSGAEAFFGLSQGAESVQSEVMKHTGGLGAHAVVVCTAANAAYASGIDLLRFGGRLVCVALPEGTPVPIGGALPQIIVMKELTIVGVAVGNRREAIETLNLAARGLVRSTLRTEKLDKLSDVFHEMEEGKLHGRVVLELD